MALAASVKRFAGPFFPFPPLAELVQRCNENQTLCLRGNERGNQTQQMPLARPLQSVLHHITKRSHIISERIYIFMLLTDDICYQCPLPILTARLLTQKKGLCFPSRGETFFFFLLLPSPPAPLHLFNLQNALGSFWEKSSMQYNHISL